eukprot:TRINITY_DN54_c4_g1_i4.p1 TRINITY_DN54_c4_g1~~TRINITY_DN54_c4_g1_i4.p1  ORF type:complete len:105 (+),score=13.89 TRINITY_DN54_c4_g1_i4:136-450(+)
MSTLASTCSDIECAAEVCELVSQSLEFDCDSGICFHIRVLQRCVVQELYLRDTDFELKVVAISQNQFMLCSIWTPVVALSAQSSANRESSTDSSSTLGLSSSFQ